MENAVSQLKIETCNFASNLNFVPNLGALSKKRQNKVCKGSNLDFERGNVRDSNGRCGCVVDEADIGSQDLSFVNVKTPQNQIQSTA